MWGGRSTAHLAESAVRFLVVHGTTGEAPTTTLAEKRAVLAFIQANNPQKLPIVWGLAGNSTQAMLETMADMDFRGLAAVMVAGPHYNRPSQEGLYQHYTALAAACPVPLLLYNVPARTGTNMEAATTLRLSEHPNIVGIKEAAGDLVQCMEIAAGKPADFLLLSGDDLLTLPMMAVGAVGVVSTVANGWPRAVSDMVELALQGRFVAARAHLGAVWQACRLIGQAGNPVGTKQLLAALGVCQHYVRLPLVPAPAALVGQMEAAAGQGMHKKGVHS